MYLLLKGKSYVQTDATTPNIVGPTVLEVVASVLVVVGKRIQQLPAMLGPAVHCGMDTTQKTLETMCNAGAWPQQCCKSCADGSNIVALRFGDHGTRNCGSCRLKFLSVSNFAQQHTTGCANGRICNIQQWGLLANNFRSFRAGRAGPYFTLVAQNIYRIINKLGADGVLISLPHHPHPTPPPQTPPQPSLSPSVPPLEGT